MDECEYTDDEDIRFILDMLSTLKQVGSVKVKVKVKIPITSSPELLICQEINKIPIEDLHRRVLKIWPQSVVVEMDSGAGYEYVPFMQSSCRFMAATAHV